MLLNSVVKNKEVNDMAWGGKNYGGGHNYAYYLNNKYIGVIPGVDSEQEALQEAQERLGTKDGVRVELDD